MPYTNKFSTDQQSLKPKARVIACYLPQFHPIPENDNVWGKGFTEWTNVAKAQPLFKGHYQPRIPADLGFYDLRMPEIREAQAQMAREAGIEGFMYWHYWLGNGKLLLEKPFQEVLQSGKPDFPFCLGWANHSWQTKTWTKSKGYLQNEMIQEQIYGGISDYTDHFNYVLPALKDERYITVDGKPIFHIYDPLASDEITAFMQCWQKLAKENGLKGIHFVGSVMGRNSSYKKIMDMGFDAVHSKRLWDAECAVKGSRLLKRANSMLSFKFGGLTLQKYPFSKIMKYLVDKKEDACEDVYPAIISGYDRAARAGRQAVIYHNCTPKLFGEHVREVIEVVQNKSFEHRIVFLKSWNEWGEGNYVEPDLKYGHGFLDELRKHIL